MKAFTSWCTSLKPLAAAPDLRGRGTPRPAVSRRTFRSRHASAQRERTSERSAPGMIRTCDLCLRRAALYPLSYGRLGGREQSSHAREQPGAARLRLPPFVVGRQVPRGDALGMRMTPARSYRPRARSARAGSSRAAGSRRAGTGMSPASGSARDGPPTRRRAQASASAASSGTSARTYASATTEPSGRRAALVTRPTTLPSCTSSASYGGTRRARARAARDSPCRGSAAARPAPGPGSSPSRS